MVAATAAVHTRATNFAREYDHHSDRQSDHPDYSAYQLLAATAAPDSASSSTAARIWD